MEEKLIKYFNKDHKKAYGVSVNNNKGGELDNTQAIFDDMN